MNNISMTVTNNEDNIITLENEIYENPITFSDGQGTINVTLNNTSSINVFQFQNDETVVYPITLADSDAWKCAEEVRNSLNNYYTKAEINDITKTYTHYQNTPSKTWNINHNLNKPITHITLIDSSGNVFYPPVRFIDNNNCELNLIGQMSGKAYLS